jgi:hypothetical protein
VLADNIKPDTIQYLHCATRAYEPRSGKFSLLLIPGFRRQWSAQLHGHLYHRQTTSLPIKQEVGADHRILLGVVKKR